MTPSVEKSAAGQVLVHRPDATFINNSAYRNGYANVSSTISVTFFRNRQPRRDVPGRLPRSQPWTPA
ncbi:hypothetical protein ACWCOT_39845 [Nonomuraea bangladeshensis]